MSITTTRGLPSAVGRLFRASMASVADGWGVSEGSAPASAGGASATVSPASHARWASTAGASSVATGFADGFARGFGGGASSAEAGGGAGVERRGSPAGARRGRRRGPRPLRSEGIASPAAKAASISRAKLLLLQAFGADRRPTGRPRTWRAMSWARFRLRDAGEEPLGGGADMGREVDAEARDGGLVFRRRRGGPRESWARERCGRRRRRTAPASALSASLRNAAKASASSFRRPTRRSRGRCTARRRCIASPGLHVREARRRPARPCGRRSQCGRSGWFSVSIRGGRARGPRAPSGRTTRSKLAAKLPASSACTIAFRMWRRSAPSARPMSASLSGSDAGSGRARSGAIAGGWTEGAGVAAGRDRRSRRPPASVVARLRRGNVLRAAPRPR